ncbi:MAG: hypothetical protein PHI67_04530 [Candidatus Methanomethylophilaceae archaeon]|nr:hypothetical protein [Candidatus Methanomethylophilaceae archaeon]
MSILRILEHSSGKTKEGCYLHPTEDVNMCGVNRTTSAIESPLEGEREKDDAPKKSEKMLKVLYMNYTIFRV